MKTIDINEIFYQIEADRMVALGTLCRRYDITREQLKEVLASSTQIRTTKFFYVPVRGMESTRGCYEMAYITARPPSTLPSALCHLAYLAEARLRLGGHPGAWHHAVIRSEDSDRPSKHARTRPDAYWRDGSGRDWWIEVDIGTYSPATRHEKIEAAVSTSHNLIWCAPHFRRLDALYQLAAELNKSINTARGFPPTQFRTELLHWHVGSEARQ